MGELVGKYADMGDTLQRLPEITVQGANGNNSSTEFTYLNKEYDELL
jgi:flagellin-like hook-associated protein FlgL